MFHTKTTAAAEATHDVVVMDPPELVALSVLQLDLDAPAVGWDAYLTGRGIPIVLDHIGRSAISSVDARQLLEEKREAEARAREKREAGSSRRLRLTVCGVRRFGVVCQPTTYQSACPRRLRCWRPAGTPGRNE
jgi:hypothetical protein